MVWVQDFEGSQEQWHEDREHMEHHVDSKHIIDIWAALSEVDE